MDRIQRASVGCVLGSGVTILVPTGQTHAIQLIPLLTFLCSPSSQVPSLPSHPPLSRRRERERERV